MTSKRNRDRTMVTLKRSICTGTAKDRYFTISVKLTPTAELFSLNKVHSDMKISELKRSVEFATGIPYHMQRLHYLDEGDLQEHTNIRHNDIIPGAVLSLDVWNEWCSLVQAVASNNVDQVLKLGVTQDTKFSTPNSEYLPRQAKLKWVANRAFTALYIAAHRGYCSLAQKLIEKGADVNSRTAMGRTPLHVASAQGHGTMVTLLLEKGADIDAVDDYGDSALEVASKYGNKGCERHLFLFRWQQRAKNIKPYKEVAMFAHQYHDSALPVWLQGTQGQLYYSNILPPGEFSGTGMSAPVRRKAEVMMSQEAKPELSADSQRPRRPHTNISRPGSGMSVIEEESSVRSSSKISSINDPAKLKSFNAWLKRKQEAEQKILDDKKQAEDAKKLLEEDRRRLAAEKERSYEQWLTEKAEGAKRKSVTTAKQPTNGVKEGKDKLSTAAIIEDILARRQQEALEQDRPMPTLTYDSWLPQGHDIIEDIRMGKTPLHRHLLNNI